MKYIKVINGFISNNTYLLYNDNLECLLIDPSLDCELIDRKIIDNNLKVVGILLTHAHYDHIFSVDYFASKYSVDVYCDENAVNYIKDPTLNLSAISPNSSEKVVVKTPAIAAKSNFKIKDFDITTMKTYGHSRACITYFIDEFAFTGDFIFCGTIGRTDFFDSSMELMIKNINEFSKLDKNYFVLPGHGSETTLEEERKNNKFFLKYGG